MRRLRRIFSSQRFALARPALRSGRRLRCIDLPEANLADAAPEPLKRLGCREEGNAISTTDRLGSSVPEDLIRRNKKRATSSLRQRGGVAEAAEVPGENYDNIW